MQRNTISFSTYGEIQETKGICKIRGKSVISKTGFGSKVPELRITLLWKSLLQALGIHLFLHT